MLYDIFLTCLEYLLFVFSVSRADVESWFKSPLVPLLDGIVILLIIFLIIHQLYLKKKKKKNTHDFKCGEKSVSVESLEWANKIIKWFFLTSGDSLQTSVESWLQALNEQLLSQTDHFAASIVGLREESSLPVLAELRSMKEVNHELHAEVLLKSTEFGFFLSIREGDARGPARKYSAIATQFECWCTAVLTRTNEKISLMLEPNDQHPLVRFKFKTYSHEAPNIKDLPQSIGLALQQAIVNTKFSTNLNPSTSKTKSNHDVSFLVVEEDEKSCYSGTEPEDNNLQRNIKVTSFREERSSSFGNSIDQPPLLKRRMTNDALLTVPGRSEGYKAFQEAGDTQHDLSGSLGSLSNMTRNPLSRGPAKPIRLREKQLRIKVVSFDTQDATFLHRFHCLIELDSPHQRKSFEMPSNREITFDLSSRSSRLKVNFRDSPSSSGRMLASGAVLIETINTEKSTTVSISMQDEEEFEVGLLFLMLFVVENSEKISVDSKIPDTRISRESPACYHQEVMNRENNYYEELCSRARRRSSPKRSVMFSDEPIHRDRTMLAERAIREARQAEERHLHLKPSESVGAFSEESEPSEQDFYQAELLSRRIRHQSAERRYGHRRQSIDTENEIRRRKEKRKNGKTRFNVTPDVDAAPFANLGDRIDKGKRWPSRDQLEYKEASRTSNIPSPAFSGTGETKITKVTRVKGSPTRIIQQTFTQPNSPTPTVATSHGGESGVSYNSGTVAETVLKDLSTKTERSPVVRKAKICITTVEQTNGSSLDQTSRDTGSSIPSPTSFSSDESEFDENSSGGNLSESQEEPSVSTKDKRAGIYRTRSLNFKPEKEDAERENHSMMPDTSAGESPYSIPQNSLTKSSKKKSSSMNKLFSRMSRKKKTKVSGQSPIAEEDSLDAYNGLVVPESTVGTKIKRSRSFKEILKGKKKPSKY